MGRLKKTKGEEEREREKYFKRDKVRETGRRKGRSRIGDKKVEKERKRKRKR